MKAIIFAAGLGTRLKPLTDSCPKALVQLNGEPLILHSINLLKKYGIDDITVNVHHFADDIIKYLSDNDFGVKINISDESDLLLDTGGGLLKARPFLDGNDPFIACNVDIISSVDIGQLIEYHKENEAIATLVVKNRLTSRYFMFDDSMSLTGWINTATGEEIISNDDFCNSQMYAFSGIQVISPEIFDLIEEKGKFSITALYLRLAQNHTIKGWIDDSEFWLDLGKPGQIELAEKYLSGLQNT